MKRLRAAYNNEYRIMHYIPSNVLYVVAHTRLAIVSGLWFPAEKQFVSIFYTMRIFIQVVFQSLQMFDAFYKSSFFLNYSTQLYDGDQMQ